MRTIRRTPGTAFVRQLWAEFMSNNLRQNFSTFGNPVVANGTTAGRLKTTASAIGRIAGVEVTKAAADDFWNLSGETTTGAAVFRAYWLYVSSAGAASFVAGADKASAADALAALPAPDETKSIWGAYVAGVSTNFAAALAAQGTIYNGVPAGASLDGTAKNIALAPATINLISG